MDDPETLLDGARAVLEETLRGFPSALPLPPTNAPQNTVINIGSINSGPITIHELTLNVGP